MDDLSRRPLRDSAAFRPFDLSLPDADAQLLGPFRPRGIPRRDLILLLAPTAALALLALVLAGVALHAISRPQATVSALSWQGVRRLAFGSCTSYDLRPQPIWDSIIAARPDGWVWLGDMAYLDTALVDCAQVPGHPQCNCSAGVTTPPYFTACLPLDLPYAQFRLQHQVQEPGYQRLQRYLCPGHQLGAAPPQGSDPAACPRPLLGVYDDHDFGNNNADGRSPVKVALKQMYLDALGEPASSPRRSAMHGLQASYTLNEGSPGREVQVVLLDERWDRDAPPCSEAQLQCSAALQDPSSRLYLRCQDLLLSGGRSGTGSCCRKDQRWAQFCSNASSISAEVPRGAVCDPASELYGSRQAVLSSGGASAEANSAELWERGQADNWQHLLEHESPMCEVLGPAQRAWLRQQLASSSAPLRIIASSSVLLGNLGFQTATETCSGDDWEVNLLHTLGNVSSGCVVVLTGDYHWGDLKLAQPGTGSKYSQQLQTARLGKPVYQLMSSGMTSSTAHHSSRACEGSYREDVAGLRPLGKCSYMADPNFGMVEVDWEGGVVSLQVRDGASGQVAEGSDGSRQELRFSLSDCQLAS